MGRPDGDLDDLYGLMESGRQPGIARRNARAVRQLLTEDAEGSTHLRVLGWDETSLRLLLLLPPLPSADEMPKGDMPPARSSRLDYSAAFAKAERSLAAFLAPTRPADIPPEILLAELEELPETARRSRFASDTRFAEPELVKRLLERSHAQRHEDPAQLLSQAELAYLAAEACTAPAGEVARLLDLKAWARGQFGNALRVWGRLREAEEALAIARRYARDGTGDPRLKARLCEHRALLRLYQRRFDEAIELTGEAGRIYGDLEETQLQAASEVNLATACLFAGQPWVAIGILHRALPRIDCENDPHLLLAACHNLVRCYIDLGLPEEACSLHRDTKDLYGEVQDTQILLRVVWQEGLLLRGLGRLEAAEQALLQARAGFRQQGFLFEEAMVALDLAAVRTQRGMDEEARRTAQEARAFLTGLEVEGLVLDSHILA